MQQSSKFTYVLHVSPILVYLTVCVPFAGAEQVYELVGLFSSTEIVLRLAVCFEKRKNEVKIHLALLECPSAGVLEGKTTSCPAGFGLSPTLNR